MKEPQRGEASTARGPHGCCCPSCSWGSRHPNPLPCPPFQYLPVTQPQQRPRPGGMVTAGDGDRESWGEGMGGCRQAPTPQAPGGVGPGRAAEGTQCWPVAKGAVGLHLHPCGFSVNVPKVSHGPGGLGSQAAPWGSSTTLLWLPEAFGGLPSRLLWGASPAHPAPR